MSHFTQRLGSDVSLSIVAVTTALFNRVALVAVCLVFLSTPQLAAQEKPVKDALPKATEPSLQEVPPAKKEYMGRVIAPAMGYAHAAWLTRDTREQEEDPLQTLANLGLKPGMVVCDLGCGNGYYTIEMAKRVGPTGKIFAVDIQTEMLHLLELRLEEKQVKNVELVLGGLIDPRMPDNSIDLLLMVDVYHEFSHPVLMLQAIRKSLKPEGRIALVEFRAEDRSVPIRPEHKMSKKQILKEYQANGLKLVEEYDKLPW